MEIFETIDWGLIAPLIIIQGILFIFAIVDWAKAEDTNGPKWMWFFIIVFVSIIGPVIYFLFGRRRS